MGEPLSTIDENFWDLETATTSQVIAAICVFKFTPDVNVLTQKLTALTELFPKLKKTVYGERKFSFRDYSEFDLNDHFEVIVEPQLSNRAELFEIISEQFSRGLDQQRPLWKYVLITNKSAIVEASPEIEPQAELSAGIFLVHHALTDGFGLRFLVNSLAEDKETVELGESKPLTIPKAKLAPSIKKLIAEVRRPKANTILHGVNSNRRQIQTLLLDRSKLKAYKGKLKVSVNDVCLAILAQAIRRYARNSNTPIEKVYGILPVNLRELVNDFNLGNRLAGVPFLMELRADSLEEQIAIINQQSLRVRQQGEVGAHPIFARLVSCLPSAWRRKLYEHQAKRLDMICSNIYVSAKPLIIANAEVLEYYGAPAIVRSQGFASLFISYCDYICVLFVRDPNVIASDELIHHFEQVAKEAGLLTT